MRAEYFKGTLEAMEKQNATSIQLQEWMKEIILVNATRSPHPN